MTDISTNTVVGYFSTHAQAQSAVEALKAAGFQAREMGVAARGFSSGSTGSMDTAGSQSDLADESTTRSGKDYEAGHTHGTGMWEKIKEFFEGDSEHTSSTRDTSSNDTSINDTSSGVLVSRDRESDLNRGGEYDEYGAEDMRHSLSGLSVPDQHSRYFGNRFSSSSEGAMVTVSSTDRQEEARSILQQYGADLGEGAADYEEDSADESADHNQQNVSGEQNIRLYGEVLRVHKDRVNRGDVRVRKEVRTDTQTIEVPVTREELVVERRKVDGEQAATDANFDEQEIRIPLSEERATLDKQAVVTEEVRVGKREVTNVQSLNDQVRHEELKVEDTSKTA